MLSGSRFVFQFPTKGIPLRLDRDKCGSGINISDDDLTAAMLGSNWVAVRYRNSFSRGKNYWEITINNTGSGYLGIGVHEEEASLSTWVGGDSHGWCWQGNGDLWTGSNSRSYGSRFTTGDVVGVELDLTEGTLTFYLNGECKGQAYDGFQGKTLYPAISMYNSGDSVTISPTARSSSTGLQRSQSSSSGRYGFKATIKPLYKGDALVQYISKRRREFDQFCREVVFGWNPERDSQLLELATSVAKKLERSVSSLNYSLLDPADTEMAPYPLLKKNSVNQLQTRFLAIQMLNERIKGLIPLINIGQSTKKGTLGRAVVMCSTVLLGDWKQDLWNAAMSSYPSSGSNSISVNRHKAAKQVICLPVFFIYLE